MRKQVVLFLVVGGLTVAVDYFSYRTLVWLSLLTPSFAKGVGFWMGTLFAYFANSRWTFPAHRHPSSSSVRFAVLYGVTMIVNVAINEGVLALLSACSGAVQIAFFLATCTSAVLNFLGMKFFVFTPSSKLS